jgi:hypothetical protein
VSCNLFVQCRTNNPSFSLALQVREKKKEELLADLYMASYVALLQAAAIKELEKALCNLLSYTLLRPKLPAQS